MTVGLRVSNVQQAHDFYQGMGFQPVMVVPEEHGAPVLCSMSYGTSYLVFDGVETPLPMLDTPRERATKQGSHGLGVKLGLEVQAIAPLYQYFKNVCSTGSVTVCTVLNLCARSPRPT